MIKPQLRYPFGLGVLAAHTATGWALLWAHTYWPLWPTRPWEWSAPLLASVVLGAVARLLAVRVVGQVRTALDSAFYVSTVFVFGATPAAWMVGTIMTVDGLVRYLRRQWIVPWGSMRWPAVAILISWNGVIPAVAILVSDVVVGIDRRFPVTTEALVWTLPTFTVVFLLLNYAGTSAIQWLQGVRLSGLVRELLLRVVPPELALAPLALAMVSGQRHLGSAYYFLLGGTFLLFNGLFHRVMTVSNKLEQRVAELSTLNKVGALIAGSLERHTLFQNISRETLKMLGQSTSFMIGIRDETETETVSYELFDGEGKNYQHIEASVEEGLSGWIIRNKKPLLLLDIQGEYHKYSKSGAYNDPRFHSWMGVPLITYDEVIGVMSVQSEAVGAYGEDHLRVFGTIADQAAVALENTRLYELATVDGLTGLLVRRHFDERLREEWQRTRRYGGEFTLGILDLDDFKRLNDTYGHQIGDAVLREAARAVQRNMRGADLAGRFGGEEFSVLLPRTKVDEALGVAQRIREEVAALRMSAGAPLPEVTVSIGLAGYPASGEAELSELIAHADSALYSAKHAGKNRVVVWTRS